MYKLFMTTYTELRLNQTTKSYRKFYPNKNNIRILSFRQNSLTFQVFWIIFPGFQYYFQGSPYVFAKANKIENTFSRFCTPQGTLYTLCSLLHGTSGQASVFMKHILPSTRSASNLSDHLVKARILHSCDRCHHIVIPYLERIFFSYACLTTDVGSNTFI